MSRRKKKWLINGVRVTLCGAALWVVAWGVVLDDHVLLVDGREVVGRIVDPGDPIVVLLADGRHESIALADVALDEEGEARIELGLASALRDSRKGLLVWALVLSLIVPFLLAQRLRLLLSAQGIRIGYVESVKLSFAGNFLNFATPLGSNAGDVFKAYFVSLHTEHKTEAVTTVLLDRIIGLASLLGVVAIMAVLSPSDSPLAGFRMYMLGMIAAGIGAIVAYLSPTLRRTLVPIGLIERLPFIAQLKRVDKAVCNLVAHKGIVVAAVITTVALQMIAIAAYFLVAIAIGLAAGVSNMMEFYAYFATGSVVQALPGPPQGLGTVELTYCYFFAPFGSASQIVCVALVIRVVVLAAALPGLFVTLTGSYKPKRALA
ncbi:MAG: flippase-like domain-containing protein [Planctomycetes bacterium]|nr:flippase-like domain-containing protein [Planctomycetota bacterium]